jgi:hypothetical protein
MMDTDSAHAFRPLLVFPLRSEMMDALLLFRAQSFRPFQVYFLFSEMMNTVFSSTHPSATSHFALLNLEAVAISLISST